MHALKRLFSLAASLAGLSIPCQLSGIEGPLSGFGYPIVSANEETFTVEFIYKFQWPNKPSAEEMSNHLDIAFKMEISMDGRILGREDKFENSNRNTRTDSKRRYEINGQEHYASFNKAESCYYFFPVTFRNELNSYVLKSKSSGVILHEMKTWKDKRTVEFKVKPEQFAPMPCFLYEPNKESTWRVDSAIADKGKLVYSILKSCDYAPVLSALFPGKDGNENVAQTIGSVVDVGALGLDFRSSQCSPLFKLSSGYGLLWLSNDSGFDPTSASMKFALFRETWLRSETLKTEPLDYTFFIPHLSADAIGDAICVAYAYPLGKERGLAIEIISIAKDPNSSPSLVSSRKLVIKMDKLLPEMPKNPNRPRMKEDDD